MSSWFTSLGYWEQEKAFKVFLEYREEPTDDNFDRAVTMTLPIIRVVFSTQKVRPNCEFDIDDMISSAALTIVKALPKMAQKSDDDIGNDKQFTRYLFTCVNHAFYRELDTIHGKHNRVIDSLIDKEEANNSDEEICPDFVNRLEVENICQNFLPFIETKALSLIRFRGKDKKICKYILRQLSQEREVSTSLLSAMGCSDRIFFTAYCKSLRCLAALFFYDTLL